MPVYLGSTKEGTLYYGGTKIKEAYYGSTKVYSSFTPQTIRFNYTGAVQTWTVPAGVTKLIVDCVGAAGGGNTNYLGGKGGRVQCSLSVAPGQTLYFYVGGKGNCDTSSTSESGKTNAGGWNGGGNSKYINIGNTHDFVGSGGGSSDIRTTSNDLNTRLVVAGAGSGGYYSTFTGSPPSSFQCSGSDGGGLIGADGKQRPDYSAVIPATGGTQNGGGTAGNWPSYYQSENGKFLYGGDSSYAVEWWIVVTGSAGGAGWYGGGGGCFGTGGGGSSYTHPSLCSNVVHTQGYSDATENGWIIITTSNQ